MDNFEGKFEIELLNIKFEIHLTADNVGRQFLETLERIRVEFGLRDKGREGMLLQIGVKPPAEKFGERNYRNWLRFLPPLDKKLKVFDIILRGGNEKYVVLRYTIHNLYLVAIGIENEGKQVTGESSQSQDSSKRDSRGRGPGGRGGSGWGRSGEMTPDQERGKEAKTEPNIKWFEFRPKRVEDRIIKNTILLPISCSYLQHERVKLENISANLDMLVAKINMLNSSPKNLVKEICDCMPGFAFLTSEALRFYTIAKMFAQQLDRTCECVCIGAKNLDMVRDWGKFSKILLRGTLDKYTLDEFVRARKEILLGLYVSADK